MSKKNKNVCGYIEINKDDWIRADQILSFHINEVNPPKSSNKAVGRWWTRPHYEVGFVRRDVDDRDIKKGEEFQFVDYIRHKEKNRPLQFQTKDKARAKINRLLEEISLHQHFVEDDKNE